MRLFIAVDLNSQNRDALAKLQTRLKKADTDVKWIEPKNIHLTLKFLGEVTEERLRILREADYIFIEELKKAKLYDKIWRG